AAPLALPTHRPLDSLRRFGTFLRLISSASLLGCQSHPSSVRKCPLIPRGHLAMCPLPVASLITHTSSRRFRPDAYSKRDTRLGENRTRKILYSKVYKNWLAVSR